MVKVYKACNIPWLMDGQGDSSARLKYQTCDMHHRTLHRAGPAVRRPVGPWLGVVPRPPTGDQRSGINRPPQ
eukprot:scaffold74471_cov63-Phaeocystis_antarctica.AAC.2